jgi:hypothetical protein
VEIGSPLQLFQPMVLLSRVNPTVHITAAWTRKQWKCKDPERCSRNDDRRVVPSSREDGGVGGSGKANFTDVVGYQARVAQVRYGGARQALIEKQHQRATTGGEIGVDLDSRVRGNDTMEAARGKG